MATWDPQQYERFGDLRTRPFVDLISRVGAEDPATVLDLGCGNGPTTLALAERWPRASVIGVDNSQAMLERAQDVDTERRVRWEFGDLADWPIDRLGRPDVIVTNAALQWVPTHREAMEHWLDATGPGGWFAMQVPGNFDAPSHRIIREVAAAQPDADHLLADYRMASPVDDPEDYAELLARHCDHVDAWETTYVQLLDPKARQADPVLEWVKGTALRPLLDKLDAAGQERFLADLRPALAEAYPRRDYGVAFPFRRVFAVGRVGEAR